MKKIAAICTLATSLSGCAAIQQATDYLASPSTSRAAANIEKFSKAFACAISNLSSVSTQVSQLVAADQATIDKNEQIYTVSSVICVRLGGTPSSAPVTVVK